MTEGGGLFPSQAKEGRREGKKEGGREGKKEGRGRKVDFASNIC